MPWFCYHTSGQHNFATLSTKGLSRLLDVYKGKVMIEAATFVLCLSIFLLGGTLLCSVLGTPRDHRRVEEIRRLRQEGLAVNQEGEG
jgi:hypothetical protein